MSLLKTIVIGKNPSRTLLRTVLTAVICVVIFKFAFRPAVIDGKSMEPTIPSRGLRFINLLSYRIGEPQRGDIVAVRMAGKDMFYLKRVLALPGETVALTNGDLWINGERVTEPYLAYTGTWTMEPRSLGPDEYWVAGDNRKMPMSQHVQGKTRRRFIAGKLM